MAGQAGMKIELNTIIKMSYSAILLGEKE